MEETPTDLTRLNRSLTVQFGHLFIGKAGALFFTFLVPILLVRALSVEEFGTYKQIFLVFSTLAVFLRFGLEASLYYFIPREPGNRHIYISQTLLFYCVTGAVFSSLSFLFDDFLAELLGNPSLSVHIPLLMLFTALMLLSEPMETIMISLKQAGKASAVIFSSEVMRAFFMVGPALFFGSISSILWGAVLAAAGRLSMLIVYMVKSLEMCFRKASMETLLKQLRYAFPFWLATILVTLADSSHFYIVSNLFGVSSFAIYSVGFAQLSVTVVLFDSVVGTSMVSVTEYAANKDYATVAFIVSNVMKRLLIVFLPASCFFFLFAREFIVLIYTDRFEASVPIFLVTLFMLPISSFNLSYVLRSFGSTTFILATCAIRLVLTILLILVLSSYLDLVGTAIAVVAAQLVANVLLITKVLLVSRLRLRDVFPPKPIIEILIFSLAATLVTGFLKSLVEISPLLVLGYGFVVFLLVYGILVFIFGLVADELRILRAIAGSFLQ